MNIMNVTSIAIEDASVTAYPSNAEIVFRYGEKIRKNILLRTVAQPRPANLFR